MRPLPGAAIESPDPQSFFNFEVVAELLGFHAFGVDAREDFRCPIDGGVTFLSVLGEA